MGVRRAVDIAQAASREAGTVYTHGPLIHNTQAVEFLRSRGVVPLDDADEKTPERLVIRAHGIATSERNRLEGAGVECIDATCPHVLASQRRIEKASEQGREIVLVGDPDHAEVRGLVGHASTRVHLISSTEEARSLEAGGPLCVLAQTTFHAEAYQEITEVLRERFEDLQIHDSICRATAERQEEARKLATECDAMVVVGGRHSANTVRLAEVARQTGKPTWHVETAEELPVAELSRFGTVGVTAGASTPGWLTQSVIDQLHRAEQRGLSGLLDGIASVMVKTYLYSALAAASLTVAISMLLGARSIRWELVVTVFGYVFAMHAVNRHLGSSNAALSSERTEFGSSGRHRGVLITAGVMGAVAVASAARLGTGPLLVLLVAGAAGIVYSVPLAPASLRYRRLKDIPASKDVFVAAAWSTVVVGPAALVTEGATTAAVAGALAVVFFLVFAKTVALDLRDTEGDRLIGTETLPVLIGESATVTILYAVQAVVALVVVLLEAYGVFQAGGWLLLALPPYGLLYLRLFHKGLLKEEVRCQLIVDGQFLLTGPVALLAEAAAGA
jgi:4-hydroxy-3-methylbut-2-enyl diphosphate reductase